jgi:hypothetical protein
MAIMPTSKRESKNYRSPREVEPGDQIYFNKLISLDNRVIQ